MVFSLGSTIDSVYFYFVDDFPNCTNVRRLEQIFMALMQNVKFKLQLASNLEVRH